MAKFPKEIAVVVVFSVIVIVLVVVFKNELQKTISKELGIPDALLILTNIPNSEKIRSYYLAEAKQFLNTIKKSTDEEQSITLALLAEAKKQVVTLPPPRVSKEYTVNILSGVRVEPANLTINAGDVVVFVNKDFELRWPSANPYPTRSSLPSLNAEGGIGIGDSFSYKFLKAGKFSYHDYLLDNPSTIGTITVLL